MTTFATSGNTGRSGNALSSVHNERMSLLLELIREAQRDGMCYCATNDAERKRLSRCVARGILTKPARAMYAESMWWSQLSVIERHRCVAKTYAKLHPTWVFCGVTAAVIWGFNVPYYALRQVHVARHRGDRYQNTETVRFHEVCSFDIAMVDGVRVTTSERTSIDCMRTLPFTYGLAVADSATRVCGWDDLHLLVNTVAKSQGRPHGLARARTVALLADARSESGGESIARANMIREGFALPDLQVEVPEIIDGHRYRVDFAWRQPSGGKPIFGECDGRIKYTDPSILDEKSMLDTLLRERRQESRLSLSSSSIVRFSFEEANSRATLARLLDAFDVPRVCPPLAFTRDARHNLQEIRRYLKANAPQNASVQARLDFLENCRKE